MVAVTGDGEGARVGRLADVSGLDAKLAFSTFVLQAD